MTDSMFTAKARTDLDGRCPEPVETVLLVHPSGRRKKVFGRKQLASRLGINNYLVLTPTHVRLYALGGRTGLKVKDELGAWPRSQVQVRMEMAERSSFMASTGSSLEWRWWPRFATHWARTCGGCRCAPPTSACDCRVLFAAVGVMG